MKIDKTLWDKLLAVTKVEQPVFAGVYLAADSCTFGCMGTCEGSCKYDCTGGCNSTCTQNCASGAGNSSGW